MKFKSNTPISDIIFAAIFFILLFIPMLKIDQSINAPEENKTLAFFKPLINSNKTINYTFGLDFNSWFSDRFFLRKKMIAMYNYLHYVFFKKNDQGIFDKDNGCFYFDFEFNHFFFAHIYKEFENLFKLNDFCKENNINLYIIMTPQRPDIYPIKNNPIYKNYSNKKFIKYIKSVAIDKNLKIIFPYEEIKKASKKQIMYYKIDYHWTDDAAFIAYKEIMKLIKKDYPFVKILNENDFDYFYDTKLRINYNQLKEYGTVFNPVGVSKKDLKNFKNVKYKYYKHKNIDKLQDTYIDEMYKRLNYYYYPEGADLRAALVGPSTIEALSHSIPFTFKNVLKVRTNAVKGINDYKLMKHYKKIIMDYKPEILILCVPYQSLYTFEEYFAEE